MSYISIRSKVLILLLFAGISCALVISFLSYDQAEKSLKTTINKHLTSIREAKKRQTVKYFADEMKAFEILSNLGQVAEAMKGLQQGFDESGRKPLPAASTSKLKKYYEEQFLEKLAKNSSGKPVLEAYYPTDSSAQHLQVQFMAENPHDLGKKDLLDQPKTPDTEVPMYGGSPLGVGVDWGADEQARRVVPAEPWEGLERPPIASPTPGRQDLDSPIALTTSFWKYDI